MNILLPIGGAGSRFKNEGYKIKKPLIKITDRYTGKKIPMILGALKDIPWINQKNKRLILVNNSEDVINGLETLVKKEYKDSIFIHDHVKLDQAFGCLLAREFLQNNKELFIGACDNGFDLDIKKFNKLKKISDVIVFTHTGDINIQNNPNAHSWLKLKSDNLSVKNISLKKIISRNFMIDHATTGMFWFKNSNEFLKNLEEMIFKNNRFQNKFYVDNVINFCIKNSLKVKFIDVRYICWGTPYDYDVYEKTINYWINFYKKNKWIKKYL